MLTNNIKRNKTERDYIFVFFSVMVSIKDLYFLFRRRTDRSVTDRTDVYTLPSYLMHDLCGLPSIPVYEKGSKVDKS